MYMSVQEMLFPSKKRAHVPSVPLIKTLNHSDLGVRPLKTPRLNNCFSSLPHFTPLPLMALRRLICLRVFISFTPISVHFCEDPGLLGPPGDHPLHTSPASLWPGQSSGNLFLARGSWLVRWQTGFTQGWPSAFTPSRIWKVLQHLRGLP